MNAIFLFLHFFLTLTVSKGNTFYVSPDGKDSNDGKSIETAWRSLDKINQTLFHAGDRVLLQGSSIFKGSLFLDENDRGTAKKPILITAFGTGNAIIEAGKGSGIFVQNTAGIHIQNITIKGLGVADNSGSGITFLVDNPDLKLSGIRIENCHAEGFGKYGILLLAQNSDKCGFEKVTIERCTATGNGEAGIGSMAQYPAISHRNVRVLHCKTWKNRGILTKTDNHSGNGIVMSGVDGLLIERCEAWQNGEDNRNAGGGPVGIWMWCCRNGVIRHCSSHDNYAGLTYDGGGFDLDGGCENCSIRHCQSWNNEGAGYLLCEFGCLQPFRNNVVEHNTSRNDGLKNSYGAITVSAPSEEFCVTKTVVRNNHIFVSNKYAVNGVPAAVYLFAHHFRDIEFSNNTFEVENGATLLRCDTLVRKEWATFKSNQFFIEADPLPIVYSGKIPVPEKNWRKMLGIKKKVKWMENGQN